MREGLIFREDEIGVFKLTNTFRDRTLQYTLIKKDHCGSQILYDEGEIIASRGNDVESTVTFKFLQEGFYVLKLKHSGLPHTEPIEFASFHVLEKSILNRLSVLFSNCELCPHDVNEHCLLSDMLKFIQLNKLPLGHPYSEKFLCHMATKRCSQDNCSKSVLLNIANLYFTMFYRRNFAERVNKYGHDEIKSYISANIISII